MITEAQRYAEEWGVVVSLMRFLRVIALAAVALLGLQVSGLTPQIRHLTLGERIAAQRAIEGVYYAHKDGASRPFEEAVPTELLERKVRTYLKQSVALERFWKTPVTGEMLRAEMERIARDTRFPDRLREIYRVLDDDPLLIQETFVRATLVDRLARSFFAFDERVHSKERQQAERVRRDLARRDVQTLNLQPTVVEYSIRAEPTSAHSADSILRLTVNEEEIRRLRQRLPGRIGQPGGLEEGPAAFEIRTLLERDDDGDRISVYRIEKKAWDEWWDDSQSSFDENDLARALHTHVLPTSMSFDTEVGTQCEADDTWNNASLDNFPDARIGHAAVWTGSHMLIWGGIDGSRNLGVGLRYDPLIDTWRRMSVVNAPPLYSSTAVWTGSHMIVWGGGALETNMGGIYDPASDTWRPVSTQNAPSARSSHSAVWTGSRMIVWGGLQNHPPYTLDTGASYDPTTDTWTPIATLNAPSPREGHSAVWTGRDMIVLGGTLMGDDVGGRYDPARDIWQPTTALPPTGRGAPAVWTGSHVLVWGAVFDEWGNIISAAIRYDPASDTWSPLSLVNSPEPQLSPTAIWTGLEMIVWGGLYATTGTTRTGGRYDPIADTWAPTSLLNAPAAYVGHTAVWTGNRMVVWGGCDFFCPFLFPSGRQYDPATDIWTPISGSNNAPEGRTLHTAVWTGTEMVVWGGLDLYWHLDSGGRYDPLTDTWRQTAISGAPAARAAHTAVWTGDRMIVWGGRIGAYRPGDASETGGLYDPISDTWEDLSVVDVPAPRWDHTAVWSGDRMVIWGGTDGQSVLATGSRYDPVSHTWEPTTMLNVPSPRSGHAAVWTGERVILWGGDIGGGTPTDTGALYDPLNDAWGTTSITDAPAPRFNHTAVWTGEEMLVWGGRDSFCCTAFSDGGRYDPTVGAWLPMSLTGAPSPRDRHAAVWTGDLMVVWGGRGPNFFFVDSGGRYSPAKDTWEPLSREGDPPSLVHSTALWTDDHVIVWGGHDGIAIGGRYVVAVPHDADGDGFADCAGDCDDADASINPGAAERCNGLDDDCDIVVDDGANALCDDGASCTEDSCGGMVGCLNDPLPVGSICAEGVLGSECLLAATCDGQGACRNIPVPAGAPCGDPYDTSCTHPDFCDGAGACAANDAPDGAVCRPENDDGCGRAGEDDDDGLRSGDDDDHGGGDDDDDDGHGDDDDDGGHHGDDDDDDGSHVCVAGACVRLGSGGGDDDQDGDGVVDGDFHTLRVTPVDRDHLLFSWEVPAAPAGVGIVGYRVWSRERSGGAWELLAHVTSNSCIVPIGAVAGDHLFQVTATTE